MRKSARFYAASAVALIAATHEARAQDNDETHLQEIVVTAQKRAQNLRDVPISVTAETGESLARRGINDVSDLGRVAAGFSFQRSTWGPPILSIRGVGFYDRSVSASPTVSAYVDQTPLPYSAMTRGLTLDLDRVEILKGPQGTIFGQNSTGGAINVIAAKPTQELSAGADITIGRFSAVTAQGFVSGGLTDNLRMRIAGRYEYQDDWQVSFAPNDQLLGKPPGDTLGKRRFAVGRLLTDWEPSETLKFQLSVNGWQDRSDTQAFQFDGFSPLLPANPFNGATFAALQPLQPFGGRNARLAGWNAGQDLSRDDYYYQFSLRGDLELGDATLTSISSYGRYRERSLTDPDGTAFTDIGVGINAKIANYYQELRIGQSSGRFKWGVGGNYGRDNISENLVNFLGGTNNGAGPFRYNAVALRNRQVVDTYAAFASGEFEIVDSLSAQAAVRYTKQNREFAGCLADPGNGQLAFAFGSIFQIPTVAGGCVTQIAPGVLPPNITDSLDEDNVSWRLGLSWKPGADSLIYGSVSRGYKAGSFSAVLPAVFGFQYAPATQESVLAYEAGAKVSLFDRKVQLNGAVFYYDYKDKQLTGSVVVVPFGALPTLRNIPKSRVMGAEIEFQARPFAGLALSGGVTWVDSEIRSNPLQPFDTYGNPANFIGEAFPNTPKWQGNLDIEYSFSTASEARIYFGGGVSARSGTSAFIGNSTSVALGFPSLFIPDYALLDLRAGIEGKDGRWKVQIWGKNVTNAFYLTDRAKPIDTVVNSVGMPVTYGLTVGFRY
ncbi:TonB-dependent receptor domain-containing protein [Sphingobium sp. MK2]|uniref:TonB-dependent receptor n=1 Tax=Sphingobium sp. MK2 TaxID=3116540 RepID=UPI0032E359A2